LTEEILGSRLEILHCVALALYMMLLKQWWALGN